METSLFDEFEKTSIAAWKNKIQVDLKGADYNDTLLWKSKENIIVKPFYSHEDRANLNTDAPKKGFNICQTIFVDDVTIANSLALDALKRGANSIQFKAKTKFDYQKLLQNLNLKSVKLYFEISFLDEDFIIEISNYINSENTFFQIDIIGNLAETGNWYYNLNEDFNRIEKINKQAKNCISVSLDLYENCGATITQQLAYTLAHANEYLQKFGSEIANKIHFCFSVGSNYFFEIAKLRAFRILWSAVLKEYAVHNLKAHIFTKPSSRNKTLYDYNVNLLRTTSECMSAILGGSDSIANLSYDSIYHKSNEFGERISRNQLLVLQQESNFKEAQNFADGSYYIESITNQLAENALTLFKQIEQSGGFLKQLKNGVIQKKIKESAKKEENDFLEKELILLGTNFQQNKKDLMLQNLELYPFVKQRNIKTLISPLTRNRISEPLEKKRLEDEKGNTLTENG
ncbi:methylmalonyl-CoA mutase subunit beta [uncultured Polaribacter sp.]|uniref:methylmalonyl-CoA mutase subunit beta n=1 Tax=uncultured Polaribacter sp. TaxID=174711 RepID=UPI002623F8A3|nr:methylmalonyl-CoA mutase subunit beta [uncultured Polaribacter sp.]